VIAAQVAEYSYIGEFSSRIDNYWGPTSDGAMTALQRYFGIAQDGCAGPITWAYIRASVFNIHQGDCRPGPGICIYSGPNYEIDISIPQYYGRARCWSSYISNDYVGGPVRSGWYYMFDRSLIPQYTGNRFPYYYPPSCGIV
jgi:hypothetical protein